MENGGAGINIQLIRSHSESVVFIIGTSINIFVLFLLLYVFTLFEYYIKQSGDIFRAIQD